MRLKPNMQFLWFRAPELGVDLGPGRVMSLDKDGFIVAEVVTNNPTVIGQKYGIPTHAQYCFGLA